MTRGEPNSFPNKPNGRTKKTKKQTQWLLSNKTFQKEEAKGDKELSCIQFALFYVILFFR